MREIDLQDKQLLKLVGIVAFTVVWRENMTYSNSVEEDQRHKGKL